MNPKKWLPYVVLAVVLTLLWRNCSKATDPGSTNQPAVVTVAQKLASVDAGNTSEPLPVDDPSVKKIDDLLTRLSVSFKEPPDVIANATYSAYMLLQRNKAGGSNLSLLQHMSGVMPIPGVRYKVAVMQYAAEQH